MDEPAPPEPGTGEINEDPELADPDSGDYRLTEPSPCIDAGNPHIAFFDPDQTRNDMGAFYFHQGLASVADHGPGPVPESWGRIKILYR